MAYTIQSGDTLSGIASKLGTSVSSLMSLNPSITDANKISAGATLNLPSSGAIPASTLSSNPTPYTVPTPKIDTTNYQSLISGGNAQIQGYTPTLTQAQLDEQNKALGRTQFNTGTTDMSGSATVQSELDKLLASLKTTSGVTDYTTMLGKTPEQVAQEQATAQSDLSTKSQIVRASQAKLAGINAQIQSVIDGAKAQNLQLEGNASASGRSTDYLNRQQNEVSRQSAIAALPLQGLALATQAEIASAQGDAQLAQDTLTAANDRFNTLFKLQEQDAQNAVEMYNNKVKLIYDDLSKKEQAKVDAQKTQNASNLSMFNAFVSDIRTLSTSAFTNGQSGVAKSLADIVSSLNPASPTFQQDYQKAQSTFASLQGKIAPKQDANLEFVSATANQPAGTFNKKTGVFTPLDATSPQSGININNAREQANLVINSINNADKLSNASGRSGARKILESWLVGSTDYTNLEAETNTLRTNVLTMLTDPAIKKFFGPQMSNTDVQLMTAAGTTLNPALQSPQAMKDELTRLRDVAYRAKMSLDGVTQFGVTKSGIRVGRMPDGSIQDVDGNKYDADGNKI